MKGFIEVTTRSYCYHSEKWVISDKPTCINVNHITSFKDNNIMTSETYQNGNVNYSVIHSFEEIKQLIKEAIK